MEHSAKFGIEIWNISDPRSFSADNAEFGKFTLLFCRARHRNVPRIITPVAAAVVDFHEAEAWETEECKPFWL